MININHVTLVGRLTKDPDLRKTQNNTSVCQFTLAVDRRFKKDNEQNADFINCIAWKQSADFLDNFASKGTIVSAEGRLQTRNYEKNGQKVFVTEVVCDNVQIIAPQQPKQGNSNFGQESSNFGGYASQSANDIISSEELPFY